MLACSVENLSKLYRLGALDRGVLWKEAASWFRPRRNDSEPSEQESRAFWALRDINFEIRQGETVGIVGANGAGKSTLLKILSRITSPTTGTVRINGRVGSLLEVGTGFNPEMTGRENVYLNGAIQGMKRNEIAGKFDQIVSFAGVEQFIDTPVKRYSSGMYVRLAFSVAAFLESEILIVDEVLSVGDQQFQNRCIQRLQDIIADGRTVLFVSHGAGQVRKLCTRAICLKNGRIICDDEPFTALSVYQNSIHDTADSETALAGEAPSLVLQTPGEVVFKESAMPGDKIVRISACRTTDLAGNLIASVPTNSPLRFHFDFQVLQAGYLLRPAAYVSDELGNILFWTCDTASAFFQKPIERGNYSTYFEVPADFLAPGSVIFSGGVGDADEKGTSRALANDVLRVSVADDFSASSVRGAYTGPVPGFLRPRLEWQTRKRSIAS